MEIFEVGAQLNQIVFELNELFAGVERTLLCETTKNEIFRAVFGEIQVSTFIEEEVEKT